MFEEIEKSTSRVASKEAKSAVGGGGGGGDGTGDNGCISALDKCWLLFLNNSAVVIVVVVVVVIVIVIVRKGSLNLEKSIAKELKILKVGSSTLHSTLQLLLSSTSIWGATIVAASTSRDDEQPTINNCKCEFRGVREEDKAAGQYGISIGDCGQFRRRLDEAAGGSFSLLRHERPGS